MLQKASRQLSLAPGIAASGDLASPVACLPITQGHSAGRTALVRPYMSDEIPCVEVFLLFAVEEGRRAHEAPTEAFEAA